MPKQIRKPTWLKEMIKKRRFKLKYHLPGNWRYIIIADRKIKYF